VVQDESLIDEMRSALQGDRDRAESRRRASEPVRAEPGSVAAPPPERNARGRFALLARLRGRH